MCPGKVKKKLFDLRGIRQTHTKSGNSQILITEGQPTELRGHTGTGCG